MGRATDSTRRKAMAQAHAKYVNYCTCGKNVSGNGGRYQHSQMHKRKNDGHYYMTYSEYQRRKDEAAGIVRARIRITPEGVSRVDPYDDN